MKIICLSNQGSFAPAEQLTPGDDGSLVYPIVVDQTYDVHGLLIAPNTCHVLVVVDFKPRWIPIGLFEITNAEMSAELEHLHAEKHVRDAELIALRAKITLLKDVLRDACPLACIEKLDAWMDKK